MEKELLDLEFNAVTLSLTESEAIMIRDRIDALFPPKIGPWTVRKARGGWCVSRDIPGKAPECAASHCKNETMAQLIADLLNDTTIVA